MVVVSSNRRINMLIKKSDFTRMGVDLEKEMPAGSTMVVHRLSVWILLPIYEEARRAFSWMPLESKSQEQFIEWAQSNGCSFESEEVKRTFAETVKRLVDCALAAIGHDKYIKVRPEHAGSIYAL
jgi:hypothetical protein